VHVTLRSTGILLCAFALLLAPGAASAAANAKVRVEACKIGDLLGESSVAFEGRMRERPGTERMWMRFTLQQRFGTPNFHSVEVPELEVWRKSKPGVGVFSYTQRVRALQPGGSYRARVEFRWYDEDGDLIASTRRHSGICGKPGPLPNLRIAGVRARPGSAEGTADYSVDVENAGDEIAENVDVTLTVDSVLVDLREASTIEPGETATLRFSGPPCSRRVKAEVDPEDGINESDETDNRRAFVCSSLFGA
jgi:hypothetical protein